MPNIQKCVDIVYFVADSFAVETFWKQTTQQYQLRTIVYYRYVVAVDVFRSSIVRCLNRVLMPLIRYVRW